MALTGATAYAYFHSGYWDKVGMAQNQPVLFSHRHHAGELHIDCRNCHATVEDAAFAGMPSTHTCLTCHSQLFKDTQMIRPLIESSEQKIPLRWAVVSRLPRHVYFNHSVHVAKGVACFSCHGDVGSMALMEGAQPLTMRWCLDCHKNPAGRLSPKADIFDAVHPGGAPKTGGGLMAFYHVSTASLTECSTCHH
ncbi:MAG TPA: cytochrome c3 family protein [Opitutaceae bacterium]|nr:cytochrome c3 family protein [Opitutaceae bacterium]